MKQLNIGSFRIYFIFVVLFILSLPFEHPALPNIGAWLHPVFESNVRFWANHIFQIKNAYTPALISDSSGLYIHVFTLFIYACLGAFIWRLIQAKYHKRLYYILEVLMAYYLALYLASYGFDKIFKHQFYLPEPNTLYTPVGQLSPDILYWTSMGSSYAYSLFAGITEVLAAGLLVFKRSRVAGALLAAGIMANILAINLSFDISVKIFTAFLFLLACLILVPNAERLLNFLFLNKQSQLYQYPLILETKKHKLIYAIAKSSALFLILFNVLFFYFQTNNFNDDLNPRPFLHGAYSVDLHTQNQDSMSLNLENENRIKRFFIHRRGYFIYQNIQDKMQDYPFRYGDQELLLMDYNKKEFSLKYQYIENTKTLILEGVLDGKKISLRGKELNWKKLPLIEHKIHWTIDEYK